MSRKEIIIKLLKLFDKKAKIFFVLGSAFIIFYSYLETYASVLLKNIIDNLISFDRSFFIKEIVFLFFIYTIGYIFQTFSQVFYLINSENIVYDYKNRIFKKFQYFEIKFFDKNYHGDILNRMVKDIDSLNEYLIFSVYYLILAISSIFFIIIAMLKMNVFLTIISILFIGLSIFCSYLSIKFSEKFYSDSKKADGEMTGYINEMLKGQLNIKVLNFEKENIKNFKKINEDLYIKSYKSNLVSNVIYPFITILNYIQYIFLVLVSSFLIMKGYKISIGTIAAFLILCKKLKIPMDSITYEFQNLSSLISSARRLFELEDNKEEIDEGKYILKDGYFIFGEDKIKYNGNFEFKNVYFGYDDDKYILKNINMNVKKGQKIALVGATGSGKTTIINLLTRFYEPSKGQILLDEINIKDIKKKSLREIVTVILQDISIVNGTIMENIRFNNENIKDIDIIKICKEMGIHNYIIKLKNGYETIISNENDVLSQGQKQLISMARARLRNTPIIILDEATSNVDTRTEFIVQNQMDKIMKDKTSFVIAHRLSTIINSDVIMVVENGEIIEVGNHNELLKLNKKYASLYNGYILEE